MNEAQYYEALTAIIKYWHNQLLKLSLSPDKKDSNV